MIRVSYMPQSRLLAARWLLILLFPSGYILTAQFFGYENLEYAALTLLSLAVCALLLTRLKRPLEQTLHFWIILIVLLIGYYLKIYWMMFILNTDSEWTFGSEFLPMATSPGLMMQAYRVITLGFSVYCIVSWFLVGNRLKAKWLKHSAHFGTKYVLPPRGFGNVTIFLIVVIPMLMMLAALIQYTLGIGIAGVESVRLPFRLGGWIFYIRDTLILSLLLLLIWCAEMANMHVHLRLGVLLLVLHGISQVLLLSTRGGLIWVLVPLMILWLIKHRLTRRRLRLIALAVLFTVLFYPIITDYRGIHQNNPMDIIGSLSQALNNVKSPADLVTFFNQGFSSVVMRIIGTRSLLAIIKNSTPLGMKNIHRFFFDPRYNVTHIYTRDILGYGQSALKYHMSSPSLLGALYMLGGSTLVGLGVVFWIVGWHTLLVFLTWVRLRTMPIAQAIVLTTLFNFTSEGNLNNIPLLLEVIFGSVALCEIILYYVGGCKRVLRRAL